jgi:hypothetical protein
MAPSQEWNPSGGGPSPTGGGFAASSGGEAPLGRIPFASQDVKNILQTALLMRIAGVLYIVNALFGVAIPLFVAFYRSLGGLVLGPYLAAHACVGVLSLAVQGAFAVLLFSTAGAFSKVASTDGEDQLHLAHGLSKLRTYFVGKVVVFALFVLFVCLVFSLITALMYATTRHG